MPGFFLHQGAQVICSHGGQATPTTPNPRVKVGGMAISTMTPLYQVSGCPNPTQTGGPCVTAQWTVAATRVQAGGDPVVLFDSQALTQNSFTLQMLSSQTRVQAQ